MAVAAAEPRKTSTDGRTERLPFGAGREVHVVQTPRRMSSPNPEIAYVNASTPDACNSLETRSPRLPINVHTIKERIVVPTRDKPNF